MGKQRDPVFVDSKGQWWHWDEVWADAIGPFDNEKAARANLEAYAQSLNKPRRRVMRQKSKEISKQELEDKAQQLHEEAVKSTDRAASLLADGSYGYAADREGAIINTDKPIRPDTLIALRRITKELVDFLSTEKCPVNSVKITYVDPEL